MKILKKIQGGDTVIDAIKELDSLLVEDDWVDNRDFVKKIMAISISFKKGEDAMIMFAKKLMSNSFLLSSDLGVMSSSFFKSKNDLVALSLVNSDSLEELKEVVFSLQISSCDLFIKANILAYFGEALFRLKEDYVNGLGRSRWDRSIVREKLSSFKQRLVRHMG